MLETYSLAFLVALAQAASGAILWLSVRRGQSTSLIELIGMGFAVGSLLAVVGAQMTIAVSLGGVGWTLPVIVAIAAVIATPRRWEWLRSIHKGTADQWVAVGVVVGIGLLVLVPSIQRTPLYNGYVTGSRYHGDLVFFEAMAQSLARSGPGDSLLLDDFGIRYHWFAYGWIGSLTDAIGADRFVVMTRIFPVLIVLVASCLAVAWATHLSKRRWTPILAGLLVVVAGFVGADQGVVLNYDSPSTAYAAVLALAFGVVLTSVLKAPSRNLGGMWPSLLMLGALAAGTMGAKASQAAVLTVGLLALLIASPLLHPQMRRPAWIAALVAAPAMLITYVLVIAGVAPSDSNIAFSLVGEKVSTFQGLDPFPGVIGSLLGSLVLILAIIPRWLGGAWLLDLRRGHLPGEAAFGLGVAVAGLLPVIVLSSGTNAGWFAVAASPLLGVLSAVGLEQAWATFSKRIRPVVSLSILAALMVNAAVFVAFGLGAASGASVLWRGPLIAWLLALVLAIPIASLIRSETHFPIRWLATVTIVLVLASIGSRFNGAALWGLSQDRLGPTFQSFIRWTDPGAEFPGIEVSADSTSDIPGMESGNSSDPGLGIAGSASSILQWSPEMSEAASWLEGEISKGDLVAVDATYLQPFLPVVTNLSMYVAGEPYISGYTTQAGAAAAANRQEQTRAFLTMPTKARAQELWAGGVRWLWLRETSEGAIQRLQAFAPTAYANDQVTVVELIDPGAN